MLVKVEMSAEINVWMLSNLDYDFLYFVTLSFAPQTYSWSEFTELFELFLGLHWNEFGLPSWCAKCIPSEAGQVILMVGSVLDEAHNATSENAAILLEQI